MTPEERAAKAMRDRFANARFEPTAYRSMEELMAMTIRAAVAEEREACAKEADARTFGSPVGNPVDAAAWIAVRIRARK